MYYFSEKRFTLFYILTTDYQMPLKHVLVFLETNCQLLYNNKPNMDMEKLKEILYPEGFIFVM